MWTMARMGKIERKILKIISSDEEERMNLPRMEGEGDELYYLRRAATSEGAILNELKKDFEEWARRAVLIHPTPASVFERYDNYLRAAKKALKRLLRKDLIRRDYISIKGVTFVGYNLTEKGRAALMEESRPAEGDAAAVLNALKVLESEGLYRLRMEDIKRKLAEVDGRQGYWSNIKIGKILKSLGAKRVKKRIDGKLTWIYENPAHIEELEDVRTGAELQKTIN